MNNYLNPKIFLLILLIIALSSTVTAYTPNWKVDFRNSLDSHTDSFTAGAGSPATDGHDLIADLRQPPTSPSTHIQVYTLVDETPLTEDYRADLKIGTPKTWEITLIAMDPQFQGVSGLNTLTCSLENTEDLNLQLIDYGDDNTKTNIINTTNLKEESSYDFNVNNALGPYRYLDLVAEFIEDEEPVGCTENWHCTDWSSCQNDIQTRTCTDQNNCGTQNNKPSETQSCQQQKSSKSSSKSSSSCTPEWICSGWSECINNKRTRDCIDERGCDKDSSKPHEIEYCVGSTGDNELEETTKKETSQQPKKSDSTKITGAAVTKTPQPNLLIGILIMLVIIIGGLTIFYLLIKR